MIQKNLYRVRYNGESTYVAAGDQTTAALILSADNVDSTRFTVEFIDDVFVAD